MKKIILLFSVFALVLTSCSSDDDDSSQDPLIGTWKYYAYLENGVGVPLDECETKETFVFKSDGTFDYTYYEEDFEGNCLLEESLSATWTNDGNNMYTQHVGGESYTETLTFEVNTFYYEEVYDNETPNDTSDDITEREVYIKQ